jgi:hypothetical protein
MFDVWRWLGIISRKFEGLGAHNFMALIQRVLLMLEWICSQPN